MWSGRKESETLKLFPGSPRTLLNRPGEQNFSRAKEWNTFVVTEGLPESGPPHLAGNGREEAETPSRPVGPWASWMAEEDEGVLGGSTVREGFQGKADA